MTKCENHTKSVPTQQRRQVIVKKLKICLSWARQWITVLLLYQT